MTEKPHCPIKNPRPEDLSTFGVYSAIFWFAGLGVVGMIGYLVYASCMAG